jgi:hypothetical protein
MDWDIADHNANTLYVRRHNYSRAPVAETWVICNLQISARNTINTLE